MTEKSILFGLIGCGRIGEIHAIQMLKHGEIIAVCDIEKSRADDFAGKFNAKPYYNYEEMLLENPDLELVSVCTPNGLHAQHSIDSLNAGAHVLCEKPMAIRTEDCHEMIKSAVNSKRKLFVVKQNRFNPPIIALKKVVDDGKLGRIYSLQLNCFWNRNKEYYENSWRGSSSLDGGTLFTQFSHFIDLLYWFLGDVSGVQAFTGNFGHKGIIDFEDTGVVILEFEQGAIATLNYNVNSFQRNMEGSITLFGEHGTVKVGGQYLNVLEYQEIRDFVIPDLERSKIANDYGTYRGSMSNHDKVYENIVDVLRNEGKLYTTPREALKTVEIINKIYNCSLRVN